MVASGLYFVIEGLAWVEGIHAPDVALETATSFFALGLFVDLMALWWRDDSGESPSTHWIPNKVFWPALLGVEFLTIQLSLLGVLW